ncbi:F-box/kelch-repeat protein At3g23880-like [Mercurialis annua]|uniref:F-box/kelch-repeat protein At3g23880-like n=1 Tax=Mercurialis annua TaxID=3986 RepID=UPI00215FEB12|nr:F-box/kelch-repeat protein At3g23880-like [Mercurialis annua]
MLENIHQEILIEILKRLPVRSLLKFRCVSKSWNSLISSSTFISSQVSHSTGPNSSIKSYSFVKQKSVPDCKERFILYNDGDDDEDFTIHRELDEFPYKDQRYLEVIGSCKGLICLSDSRYARFYVWNPIVKKCLTIFSLDSSFVVGFGYDYKKNDYKVVKILHQPEKTKMSIEVKIYEVSTSSWRSKTVANHGFVTFCFGDRKRTYLNGVYHWLARIPGKDGSSSGKLTLASFDLGIEVFKETKIPDELAEDNENHLSLVVCGDSLALIQHLSWKSDDFSWSLGYYENCCIWVLNEYGWSKRRSFGVHDYGGLVRVLSFRRNGKILLQIKNSDLASCDPETQKVTCHGGYPYRSYFKVHDYVESLVLLGSPV